jgi:hypothetical protein
MSVLIVSACACCKIDVMCAVTGVATHLYTPQTPGIYTDLENGKGEVVYVWYV